MKILLGIIFCTAIACLLFFGVGEVAEHLYSSSALVCEDHYPCYTPAMKNISVKCGVLGSDDLWGTAMKKISDCIDKLDDEISIIHIDKNYDDRIIIGKSKFDWLQVRCISHIDHGEIVNDYCDNSPIEEIYFYSSGRFYEIYKKYSVWRYIPGNTPSESYLVCIAQNNLS